MSRHTVGERVGALLSAKDNTVQFLGYGVYEGDLLTPTWEQDLDELVPVFSEYYRHPSRWSEKRLVADGTWTAERKAEQLDPPGLPSDEDIAREMDRLRDEALHVGTMNDEDFRQWLKNLDRSPLRNPCLKLDDGQVVWGRECWWASENVMKERLAGYEADGWVIEKVTMPTRDQTDATE